MQKTKKQLLGLAGLAIVAVMTAIAIALPVPDAAAANNVVSDDDPSFNADGEYAPAQDCAEQGTCASGQSSTNISVRVGERNVSVSFITPQDGDQTVNPVVPVKINWSEATTVQFTVKYTDPKTGAETVKQIAKANLDSTVSTGDYSTTIDLKAIGLGEYGYYTLTATVEGVIAGTPREDTVGFYYGNIAVTNLMEVDSDGNPLFSFSFGENVAKMQVQAYDREEAIFVDKDGEPTPLLLDRSDADETTGNIKVALPFAKYNAKPGKYTVVTIAYNADGDPISKVDTSVDYKVETPDTPNTGMLLDDLNISRLDYLLTGLIAFGTVAGFAVFLICRRNRR